MQCFNMCCVYALLFKGLIDLFLAGDVGGRVAGCEQSVLRCDEGRGRCPAESPTTSGREVRKKNTAQQQTLCIHFLYNFCAVLCFRKNRLKKDGEDLIQKLQVEIDKVCKAVNELDKTQGGLEVRPKRLVRHYATKL